MGSYFPPDPEPTHMFGIPIARWDEMIAKRVTDLLTDVLDECGVVTVDSEYLEEMSETIARLRNEKRRLLAFRDQWRYRQELRSGDAGPYTLEDRKAFMKALADIADIEPEGE